MTEIRANDIYKSLYTTDKTITLVTGGRGSGKSFFVHDWAVRRSLQDGHGILFLRYTMTSAEKSILPEFENTLKRLNLKEHYHKSGTSYQSKINSSFFLFSGIKTSSGDQTANLKSIPNLTTLIVEEGEDFNDEDKFLDILLSIRSIKHPLKVVWVMNPSNLMHFIWQKYFDNSYKTIEIEGEQIQISTSPDINHIHTYYKNNQVNLPEEFKSELKLLKENNPKKYAHKVLGQWIDRFEGTIFNNWIIAPFDDSLPFIYVMDHGQSDPHTLLKFARKGNNIYVHELHYKPLAGIGDIVNMFQKNNIDKKTPIVSDINQNNAILRSEYGYNVIDAKKPPGSVLAGIRRLQDKTIHVTESSTNIIKELKNYIWLDKKGEIPCDNFNHTIDPIRYGDLYFDIMAALGQAIK
jgi:phage terminase large subunit